MPNPFGFTEQDLKDLKDYGKPSAVESGLAVPTEGATPAPPPEDEGRGVIADVGLGIFNGARQGVLNTVDGLLTLAEEATQFVAQDESIDFDKGISKAIRGGEQALFDTVTFGATEGVTPEDEAATLAGGLAKGLSQFLIGFIGPSKFIKAAGVGNTIIRGALAGGVADFFAFGAHEERLANLVQSYPHLKNPITEFLAADESDTEVEGRLKNLIEGGLLGIGAEGAIKLTGTFMKSMKTVKGGIDARTKLDKLHPAEAEQVLKEAESVAKGTQFENLDEAVNLEGQRLDDEISKRSTPVEGDVSPAAKAENQAELDALNTRKEELPRVKEALGGTDPKPKLPGINMTDAQLTSFKHSMLNGDIETAFDLVGKDFNPAGFDSAEAFVGIGSLVDDIGPEILTAKGGAKETWKEVGRQVEELVGQGTDESFKVMEGLYGNTQNLSAKVNLSYTLMLSQHKKVMGMTKALDAKGLGDVTENELADWVRAANNAGEVQSMMKGIQTNVARALNSMKMGRSSREALSELRGKGGNSAEASTKAFVERKKTTISVSDVDDAPIARNVKEPGAKKPSKPSKPKDIEFETAVARNADGTIDSVTMRSKDGKIEVDLSKRFESDLSGAPVNDEDFVFNIVKSGAKKAADGKPSKLMQNIIKSLKAEIPELESLSKRAKELGPETGKKPVPTFEGIEIHSEPPKQRPRSAKPKTDLDGAKSGPVPRLTATQRQRSNAELIASHGGGDRIKQNIRAMAISERLGAGGSNFRAIYKVNNTNLATKMFINNLLSGPRTFVRNFVSNTGMLLAHPTKDLLAGAVNDMFIHDVNGANVADAMAEFGELFTSIMDSFRLGGKYLGLPLEAKNSGINPLSIGVEAARTGRSQMIPGGNSIFETIADVGGSTGLVHQVFEVSGRGLLGADDFFKAISYRMEMKRLARSEARVAGMTDDAAFIDNLLANPNDEMVDAAFSISERNTFTQPLGDWGKKVQGLTSTNTRPGQLMKFIMPFVRTPINILKEVGKSTPLAYKFSNEVQAEIAKGGISAQRAVAQMAIGSASMVTAFGMVSGGLMTGGGPREFRSQLDAGKQPYSFVIPHADGTETYISYDRIEPFGVLLGIAADIAEAAGEMSQGELMVATSTFTSSFMKLTMDRSYMSGLSKFMEFVTSITTDTPEQAAVRMSKFSTDMAANFIPFSSALNQTAQSIDDTIRENRTMMDRILRRIPGMSFTIPPRLNIFGEPAKFPTGFPMDIVSPVGITRSTKDPVKLHLAELRHDIQMPDRSMNGVDLNAEQYNEYLGLINRKAGGSGTMKQEMGKLINSSFYKKLPDNNDEGKDSKVRLLERVVSRRKTAARGEMKRRHKGLAHSIRLHKMNQNRAKRGLAEIPDPNSRNPIVEAFELF